MTMYIKIIVILLFSSICLAQSNRNSEVIPIVKISPAFPLKAQINRTNGYAKILMHINSSGSVDKVEVVESSPGELFDASSIAAGMKFKFVPKFVDGKPVSSKAAITIDYEIPEGRFKLDGDPLFEMLRSEIEQIPYNSTPVIIANTVKIKSEIKPKNVVFKDMYFKDDRLRLDPVPVLWDNQSDNAEKITDIKDKIEARVMLVEEQYELRPGLFKRYHRIYTADDHPPVLLNSINSVEGLDHSEYKKYKFQLTINKEGKVSKWKSLLDEKDNENPYSKQYINRLMSTLTFLPALKNGQPISDEIKIEFKTHIFNQGEVMEAALMQNKHHIYTIPWVKLVGLINKKGRVEDVNVIQSSNQAFETIAVQRFKTMKFKKGKRDRLLMTIIEFEPQNNTGQ